MTNFVGIKFIFKPGHWISAIVPAADAARIIADWRNGVLKTVIASSDTQAGSSGMAWAVSVQELAAVHAFPLDQMQGQGQQASPVNFGYQQGMSGGRN